MDGIDAVRRSVLAKLDRLRWLALLLGRLAVGLLFMSTGWGKVHDIVKEQNFVPLEK